MARRVRGFFRGGRRWNRRASAAGGSLSVAHHDEPVVRTRKQRVETAPTSTGRGRWGIPSATPIGAPFQLRWAGRPPAAARALLFVRLADDPSARPELTEEEQDAERERLFDILRDLVRSKSRTNEAVRERARTESSAGTPASGRNTP